MITWDVYLCKLPLELGFLNSASRNHGTVFGVLINCVRTESIEATLFFVPHSPLSFD